jgi:transposase-like protein
VRLVKGRGPKEGSYGLHANAVLSVRQRQRLCDPVCGGVTITAAALVVGCSRQTASKWVGRWHRGEGLRDRSSRPHRSPMRTSDAVEQAILRARQELREGPHIVGWALGIAASTVHAVLRRHGCSRLRVSPPRAEIARYERASSGELVHVDQHAEVSVAPPPSSDACRCPRRSAVFAVRFCPVRGVSPPGDIGRAKARIGLWLLRC